jgi:hypothetical protein
VATLRAYRTTVLAPEVLPKLRAYRTTVSSTAITVPTLRVYRTTTAGTNATVLEPLEDVTAEPLSLVPLTAVKTDLSVTPDSYSWRRVSGAAASIVGTGATVSVKAPAAQGGTSVTIGVRAVVGAWQSPEQEVTITTPPHQWWSATSTGPLAMYPPVPA